MLIQFPLKGKDENWGASTQPPQSSPHLCNVRPYDTLETRARGGQRPGLDKWGDGDCIGSGTPIVALLSVTYMELP